MDWRRLPKVELHLHLDCSLSYAVVSQIDPSITLEEYRAGFIAPAKCRDLADALSCVPNMVALMQTEEQLRAVTLDLFEQLVPTFRVAYESFPFSWVYVTTVDEAMMIYPYLPIEQALNDGTPTQTVYYRAADFAHHAVGWTPPYLDLVGAGMMAVELLPGGELSLEGVAIIGFAAFELGRAGDCQRRHA